MSCREKKALSNNHSTLSWLDQNTGAPALGCNQESTRLHIKLHSAQLNFKLLRWFRCPLRLPELLSPFPLLLRIPFHHYMTDFLWLFFDFSLLLLTIFNVAFPQVNCATYDKESEQGLINQENASRLMLNPSGGVNKGRANSRNRAQAIAWLGKEARPRAAIGQRGMNTGGEVSKKKDANVALGFFFFFWGWGDKDTGFIFIFFLNQRDLFKTNKNLLNFKRILGPEANIPSSWLATISWIYINHIEHY